MKTGAVDLFSAFVYNCIKSYFIVTFIIVKYCEIADAGGWYTDKRSSEQNGYASRLFWSSRNVKNMSERNARKRIKWLNFRRKFIPCRELFLTKTASKWSVRSIPFCDAERSVYQPPASASPYLQNRIRSCKRLFRQLPSSLFLCSWFL